MPARWRDVEGHIWSWARNCQAFGDEEGWHQPGGCTQWRGLRRKSKTCVPVECEVIKAEVPLLRVLLGGINGFMKPDIRLWDGLNWEGNPIWLSVQGVQWDTLQLTGSTRCEGASCQQWKSGAGSVTSRESREWADWEVSSTLKPQLVSAFPECSVLIGCHEQSWGPLFVFWFIGLGNLISWTIF